MAGDVKSHAVMESEEQSPQSVECDTAGQYRGQETFSCTLLALPAAIEVEAASLRVPSSPSSFTLILHPWIYRHCRHQELVSSMSGKDVMDVEDLMDLLWLLCTLNTGPSPLCILTPRIAFLIPWAGGSKSSTRYLVLLSQVKAVLYTAPQNHRQERHHPSQWALIPPHTHFRALILRRLFRQAVANIPHRALMTFGKD